MTNEEILQTFSDINHAYNNSTKYDTLKRMLDELTEPCGDCISRKALLEEIENGIKAGNYEEGDEYCDGYYDGMRNALAIIDKYKAESEPQERDET